MSSNQSAPATQAANYPPQIQEKNISDHVLNRIAQFQANGELKLPTNYSAENAVKSAWLILHDTYDMNKKCVLEVCTKESIANSLLKMVTQALNPVKKQCYFIAYGNKLDCFRSYNGSVALAKRVAQVKDVFANAVYEDDKFSFEINPETGRKRIVEHSQTLESLDQNKVKGAYAIITMEDGSKFTEIMNINQIRRSWEQGQTKGSSKAHTGFSDEMSKRTVINRALKILINSSDDSDLYEERELPPDNISEGAKDEIRKNGNREKIGFDEAEVLEEGTESVKNNSDVKSQEAPPSTQQNIPGTQQKAPF